jgi:hypothetical protein
VTIKYSIIFVSIFALLLLFANISNVNNVNVFAQNSTNSIASTSTTSKTNGGLKITSPEKESVVPTNSSSSFIVKGISKDNATDDCKVSIIFNNVKPYQPVQALGVNGKEDYSNWQYVLSKNYTNIMEGSNKITAKSTCLNDNPQNTYYSVNVTGMGPEQFKNYNQTNSKLNNVSSLATIDPQQHPVALEIQNIIKGSPDPSQFAFVVDNNNTNQGLNGSSSNPILNNTAPLVSNSTALNSTAFGLNGYSVVPVVSNNTTFGSNNTAPLVSNSTALNSTALNSTAFGLNGYSVVPVVSNSSIPTPIPVETSNIIPASSDSNDHKSDNSKSDNSKSDNSKSDNSKSDRHQNDHSDDKKSKDKPKSNVKKDKPKSNNKDRSSNDLANRIINEVNRKLSDAGIDI